MTEITCSVCGKVLSNSRGLTTHMRFHNADYKNFIKSRLNSKESIEKRTSKLRVICNDKNSSWYQKVHDKNVRKKQGETLRRRYEDPSFASRVGFQRGEKNPMRNPTVREKVSCTLRQQFKNGRKTWITGKKAEWLIGDKNPSTRPEVRRKIRDKLHILVENNDSRVMKGLRSGWNNHPASKPKYPDGRGNLLRSKLEVNVAKVLQELNLDYVYEPRICGYFPDFQIVKFCKPTNKLIEFDGGMRSEDVMKKKLVAYTNAGYDVLVLTHSSRISIKEKILRWLSEENEKEVCALHNYSNNIGNNASLCTESACVGTKALQ
jgi:hypothetical protein